MKEVTKLSVGEIFPQSRLKKEGVYLLIDGSGIMLWLNYDNPTDKEIDHWTKPNKTYFGYTTINNTFFFLARAEGENWIDAPYCPQISRFDYSQLLQPKENEQYGVVIMMTNQVNGVIAGLRMVSISSELSIAIKSKLDSLLSKEPDLTQEDYMRRVDKIYQEFPKPADIAKLIRCKCVI